MGAPGPWRSSCPLLTCYKVIVAGFSSLAVSCSALFYDSVSPYGAVDAFKVVDLAVLCEQYLDGCEVDVGVVMSEGVEVHRQRPGTGAILQRDVGRVPITALGRGPVDDVYLCRKNNHRYRFLFPELLSTLRDDRPPSRES